MKNCQNLTAKSYQRQTLIWEFMHINPITGLHKLKVLLRLNTKLVHESTFETFKKTYKRIHNLLHEKIKYQLTKVQYEYYFHLLHKLATNNISLSQFNKSVQNLFKYYGV